MAHLDLAESGTAGNLEALFWWRREPVPNTLPSEPLARRLTALAERAAPAAALPAALPEIIDLPGNRLRQAAATHRAADRATLAREDLEADLLAAIHHERRNALYALATGIVATVAPLAAAVYAAATHENLALGFALAGTFAASFALYHALRWFMLMRSDELPKIFL